MDNERIKILEERDKLKPKFYDEKGWPRCPVCNKMVGDGDYCRFCGQHIGTDYGSESR